MTMQTRDAMPRATTSAGYSAAAPLGSSAAPSGIASADLFPDATPEQRAALDSALAKVHGEVARFNGGPAPASGDAPMSAATIGEPGGVYGDIGLVRGNQDLLGGLYGGPEQVASGDASLRDEANIVSQSADIPPQDVIYEQLAHGGAYFQPDVLANVGLWGYELVSGMSVENDPTGFGMAIFQPSAEAQANPAPFEAQHGRSIVPVVAFRGTDGMQDLIGADADSDGVGVCQFEPNEARIRDTFSALGTPDVVGHSLGGALAQLAAARIGGVGRIVTFQAPGINAEDLAKLDPAIESTHYRVEGDVVSMAGDGLTPGEVITFDLDGCDGPLVHSAFPLAELSEMRGDEIEGLHKTGEGIEEIRHVSSEDAVQGGEEVREAFGNILDDWSANADWLSWAEQLGVDVVVFVDALRTAFDEHIGDLGLDEVITSDSVHEVVREVVHQLNDTMVADWVADQIADSLVAWFTSKGIIKP